MDTDPLEQISRKLSVLITLQLATNGAAGVKENVERLSKFGLSANELALILNTTPGTIAVAKNRLKGKHK